LEVAVADKPNEQREEHIKEEEKLEEERTEEEQEGQDDELLAFCALKPKFHIVCISQTT
jgi:hypothetical protein